MDYKNAAYLVEAEWLEENLHQKNLRIFDVTGMLTGKLENLAQEKHFNQGHIPGATFLDVASAKGVLSDPANPLPWMWPQKEQFEQLMSRCGVTADSHVVLYAASPRAGIDSGIMWCTRAWWVLHHMGVQCSILNGGWEQWLAGDHPVTAEVSTYPSSSFQADHDGLHAIADKTQILQAQDSCDQTRIVDALSPSSYLGEGKPVYGSRKGHITGAENLPFADMIDTTTGKFLDGAALNARLQENGLLSAERIITYCGGGIGATVNAFCLALMGHENISVYDGSLFEWASDHSLPMTDLNK